MQEAQPTINLAESATGAIDSIMGMLSDDAEPPKELITVKTAVQEGEPMAIGAALYGLLVEQALDYDMKEGTMVTTSVDWANVDTADDKVREKMAYIYTYGINMFKRGYISEDSLKDAILNKVACRVGMDGPTFDKWLDIPKVEV